MSHLAIEPLQNQNSDDAPLTKICQGKLLSNLFQIAQSFWHYLKEVAGDNDYGRYLAGANEDGTPVMTAEQFYLWQLRRKYSRINRCC